MCRYPALLLALFASTAAHAHYPHDVAHWAAVSPDPAEPRWATSLERINLDLLGRSEDGLEWAARLVPGSGDYGGVESGAFLTPLRLVLATPGSGLLISEDAGDTILRVQQVSEDGIARVAASPEVLDDGLAFAAGEGAVWRTTDAGSSWEPVLEAGDEGFTDLDLSPDFASDGRVCALEPGGLACSEDHGESWVLTTAPADSFRISVGAGERLWAAVRGGGLYASGDQGASWSLAGFEGEDVAVIAELSDGLVLMALAAEAAWRSTDGGETFFQVDVVEIPFDQSVDGVNFFDFFEGPDGAVYSTNWFGLARSEDAGETFTFFDTEPIRNAHSVAFTDGVDGELQAWIGTYGGGPVLTGVPARRAQDFPSLRGRFTRDTTPTVRWGQDGVAIFDEGYDTYLSTDGGAGWQALEEVAHDQGVSLENDVKGVAVAPDASVDGFMLLNVGQGAMQFMVSEDLGESWTVGSQDPPCTQAGLVATISPGWPDSSRAWASCHGVVYETLDRGLSWSAFGDAGAFVFEIAEQHDGALLVASRDGLWRMDGASSERIAFEGQLVMSVAAAQESGDPTVFALVPDQGWFRSDDSASSWVELAGPTTDFPRMIAMSPYFSEDGIVAVAGYGGAWASADRGGSWASIHLLEVYESDHDAWKVSGDWTTESWDGASGTRVVTTREVGASRTLSFQGVEAVLTAPTDADEGAVAVSLDGGAAEWLELPTDDGFVWRARGLAEGWHSLRVEAVSGSVTLDSLRVALVAGADAGAVEEPTGCSCRRSPSADSGAQAYLLLPPLVLLGWRRRLRGRRWP
jgi:hypothetical protein